MLTQESSAANRAASYPEEDGEVVYENHLHHLYGRLKTLYRGHPAHQTSPPTIRVGRVRAIAGRTCMVDDRCDDLTGRTGQMVAEEFPPESVDALLWGTPPPMLLDLEFSDGAHTVREACVAAIMHDAANNRIFPSGGCAPVDPATTGPELEVTSAAAVMRSYLG